MAHDTRSAGHRLAGLVDHDLLAAEHGAVHGVREELPVAILEAFDVDADGLDFGFVGKVAQQVAVREVGLVAQREHVARIEPGVLAQPRDHEGTALAQQHRVALGLLLRLR